MVELGPFTRAQRILAVLLPYYQRSGDWTVPKATTQAGMAEILDLPIQRVSRTLMWLYDNGLVSKKRRYVEGWSHKRIWTYLPTWEGIQYMKTVEEASGYKAREIPTIAFVHSNKPVKILNDPVRVKMEQLEEKVETEGVRA